MSDYHSRHHFSSQYDPATTKSERSFPRGFTRSANNNDLSYKDLRNEYSKVISYVDSVRKDRSYQSNPRDNSTDITSYSAKNNPSVDDKYSSCKQSSVLKANPVPYLDYEKKIIELEQEVSELKKLLEANYSRISVLQRENQAFQDRLKEFKQIDHCNKQLGNEMKTLDYEVINLTKKMKDLETENSKLLAEKNALNTKSSGPKDFQKNLNKYGNYVGHLLSNMEKDHFGRFCFEERFSSEQDFLRLVETKDTNTLLIQAFRYIGDLLLNINSTNKSVNTSTVMSPKKNYMNDLNETYSSTPAARGLSGHANNLYDDTRGIRASYAQSANMGSSKGFKEEHSAKLSDDARQEAGSNYGDDKKQSASVYQARLRNELAALHKERDNERAQDRSTDKINERLNRSNNESRLSVKRADSKSVERKPSRLETQEERSQYRREDSRYTPNDAEKSYVSRDKSPAGQRSEKQYRREESRSSTAEPENLYVSKEKSQRSTKDESRRATREDYESFEKQRRSSPMGERLIASENKARQTPPTVVTYDDVINKKKSNRLEVEPQARRAATEVVESHYYEDIPTFSGPSLRMSGPQVFEEDLSAGSRKGAPNGQSQYKSSQFQRPQEYETSSDDPYPPKKSPKSLKASERSTKTRQQEFAPQNTREKGSLASSQVISRPVSKKPSEVMSPGKDILSNPSPKRESKMENSQQRGSTSKQNRRPANIVDPAETFVPSKWEVEEDPGSQQHIKSRATPTYSQGRPDDYGRVSPVHTEPNVFSKNNSSVKQATPKGIIEKARPSGSENRSKSPVGSKKNTVLASVLDPKHKEGKLPSPINKQNTLTAQNSSKLFSQSPSQVSQYVYRNQKSLQDSVSPTASNVSLRPENIKPTPQPRFEEKEIVQRGSQLIQRENELIQKIRELKEKEKELMEREKEIEIQSSQLPNRTQEKATPANKSRDAKQMTSPKEKTTSSRTPKDQRTTSPYKDPRSNKNTHHRESSGEVFTDYIDEFAEPVVERNVVRQASLSPRSQQDSDRQVNIRPILKNSESRHDSGHYGNPNRYEPNNTQGSRRERQDTNPDYDGYDNDSRGRRSPYVQTSEDEQRREQAYYNQQVRSAGAESNHRKKLTFGTDVNFDQDITSIQNESYISEQREPTPERKSSPSKSERGTNYPSFKVSFGRTESRYKRSMSPGPNVASIMDVPRKKRVDHIEQTYDVIKGHDYDWTEGDNSTVFNNSKDTSQIAVVDMQDVDVKVESRMTN